jgi:hypothetical protein
MNLKKYKNESQLIFIHFFNKYQLQHEKRVIFILILNMMN